jgi:hypothetical protein
MDKKIRIVKKTRSKDDESFHTENAQLIRFDNVGQTRIWIDEQIVLDPGESFIEGDNNGPGIDHKYQINFLAVVAGVAVDVPKVYAGNRLHVRLFKRLTDARK